MGVAEQSRAAFGAVLSWALLAIFVWVVGAQGSIFPDLTLLVCGQERLQLTLPPGWEGNTSFVLTAWDAEGKAHALQNDSDCGLWVSGTPDGSREVSVSYTGCFVFEWDGNYLLLLGLEGRDAAGQKVLREEKLFRCPVDLPALDAPSSSVCSAVPRQDRLPCVPLPVTQGICEARGCCSDPQDRLTPCYYGSTVTAHCTPEGQFSIAVSRDVTLPPILLGSLQLASGHQAGCVPAVTTTAFAVYHFPVSACGTTLQVNGDQVIYENELVASRDVKTGDRGSVTRDSTFRLRVRCSYPISGSTIPLGVQVLTLPPLPAVSQTGPLALELRVASDGAYTSYYADKDYPLVKTLRDPLYAEVRLLQRTDPDLVLVLEHCWATPSSDAQQHQWPVLVDGCPYAGDNYQTELVALGHASGLLFPSHHQRFTLYTFTFVDSTSQEMLSGLVYLHCSASLCHQSLQQPCTSTCPPRTRGKRDAEHPPGDAASRVSSRGPVIFLPEELRWEPGKDGLGAAAAPRALVFAALGTALGMVLVAAVLWGKK
ncbi:ZP4 protein, partial [Oreotrochilus melanogaster]|nr:ZP4 protein [Oreotrochilus melanogaster]